MIGDGNGEQLVGEHVVDSAFIIPNSSFEMRGQAPFLTCDLGSVE